MGVPRAGRLIEVERGSGTVTTVAEEELLTTAELELTVDPIAEEVDAVAESTATADGAGEQAFIRIVKGSPSDAEIAALVCVFAAAASGDGSGTDRGPSDAWGRPTLMHRGTSPFSPYAFPQLSHLR